MDHYQLTKFELKDAGNNNAVLLAIGSLRYKAILQRAFDQHYFSRTFQDHFGRFEWGTYIYNIGNAERVAVERLLLRLQETVCIEDDLTETFALGYHTQMDPVNGGYSRTALGSLIYNAKPYRGDWTPLRQQFSDRIVAHMIDFIRIHPTYARAEVIIAAPPSNHDAPNLPVYLAGRIADQMDKVDGTLWIRKTRATSPMKNCRTVQEKINNVKDAFTVLPVYRAEIKEQSIILLDDVYQTGFTVNEVGRTLFRAGPTAILGLVTTKTSRDLE